MINRYISGILIIGVSLYFLVSAFNFNGDTVSANNMLTQDKRTCGTMILHDVMMNSDTHYKKNFEDLQKFIKNYAEINKDKNDRMVATIPVVVHVVYNTANQNVSLDQVITQIDVLNRDYRKLNIDTSLIPSPFKQFASDLQLQFCLARRDPSGNPTLGVTRTFTTVTSWGLNSGVKFTSLGGHDAWPNSQYLNMWVCNLGAGLLGYATFPGGNPQTDGVVITYDAFGTIGSAAQPFNKGRTATHEIGHWLSLFHIWGDDNGGCFGTDEVEDTPNQGPEYYGCPVFPQITCDNGPNGAMYMNYMDYTDDACMFMFTAGQKLRTDAVINGVRLPLQTSQGCQDVAGVPICYFTADSVIIPFGRDVQFTDRSAGIPSQWQWTFNGGNPAASTQQNPNVIYSAPGIYTVRLKVLNSFGTDSLVKTGYIRVLGAPLSSFSLQSPPSFTRINVNPGDTSVYNFTWTRSSNHPTVRYKIRMKRIPGNNPEYAFNSNMTGADSSFTVSGNFLDSLAKVMSGSTNYDSVRVSWRVYAYNGLDSLLSANTFLVTVGNSLIGIEQISSQVPGSYRLFNNFPNPFNPVTKIKFDIPASGSENIRIVIYDINGKTIDELINNKIAPGTYEITWDASEFSSGIYFLKLETAEFSDIKKMLLIK